MRKIFLLSFLIPLLLQAQNQPTAAFAKSVVAKNAAAFGIAQNDLANWRVADAHYDKHANAMYVHLQQTYSGIDIDGAINSLSFKNDKFVTGNLSVLSNLSVLNKNVIPSIDAKTALVNAAQSVSLQIKAPAMVLKTIAEEHTYQFDKLGISYNEIPVKLIWYRSQDKPNELQLAWQVTISSNVNNALWNISVDAVTGKILNKTNLTVYEKSNDNIQKPHQLIVFEDNDQQIISNKSVQDIKAINSAKYNVIAYPNESPLVADPGVETDPWTRNNDQNANTLKWNSDGTTDYKNLRGNNVFVQQDLDSNNNTPGYSPNSSTSLPDLTFNFTFDPNADPTESPDFGETNLFYWDNLMHDLSYQYGFDEGAGNFQTNNLGRGGKQNDFVYADAQDGGGKGTHIDNANFATPADGSNPRQQMYLWFPNLSKTFYVNSPNAFKGGKPSVEGNVSNSNKLNIKGPITSDIVIFIDALHPDSSNACGSAANASALAGKIAYVDRGSCNFTVKYHNAQSAGAKAIIVGNVSPTDPRYIPVGNAADTRGDVLITMSATPLDNSITIPGVFIQYDSAQKLKSYGSGNVNATLQYTPDIDGEIDNTIPTHEYTHGISTRLIGTACLSNQEQMGEGWSDWYALMVTQNWAKASIGGDHIRAIGNYAFGLDTNGTGIRIYPYSTNFNYDPWTYDSLKTIPGSLLSPPDPHAIGEMWTTMLWDMTWNLVKDYGISQNIFDATGTGGNIVALSLVTEGLKQTKCSPGFADGRDGILKADTLLYGGKYSKEIWTAFANRGLGYSAKEGSTANTKDGVPAYDVPSALPVNFGNFTAEKQGSAALLKWTTEQESNTDKFVVERSTDGKQFSEVGEVKAAGNSSIERSYQYTDAHPVNGNNIYHIKEVDKDGKANYSDVRSLNFSDVKPSITISPNPATNFVTIQLPGNTQNLNIRLLSNTGQQIANYVMNSDSYKIDVSKLASGVYNIVIEGNNDSTKYKLIVQ
ncbi:MAG: M36 family metallopeptidase [Parafilimonas sp.]|nr:M36 family metallopeptidase [Parafilimonas sp.]